MLHDLRQDRVVLSRMRGDRHERVVLGGGAHETGTTDVDLLNGFLQRDSGPLDRGCEGIEIDHHQFKRHDPVLRQSGHVVVAITAAEDSAKDLGMQRLEPAVHHFGKAGVARDFVNGQAGLLQRAGRAARAVDRHAGVGQGSRKLDQPLFVTDTDQSALD